jgi:hypothetical protein
MKQITITILFAVALMLLMTESEDIAVLLMTKVAAFCIGYIACRMCDSLESALSNLDNKEG